MSGMKGLIFMVIVTLVVLASFARPEKEISSPTEPTINKGINAANNLVAPDSSRINYKKG
jgi:hypothetical protein